MTCDNCFVTHWRFLVHDVFDAQRLYIAMMSVYGVESVKETIYPLCLLFVCSMCLNVSLLDVGYAIHILFIVVAVLTLPCDL